MVGSAVVRGTRVLRLLGLVHVQERKGCLTHKGVFVASPAITGKVCSAMAKVNRCSTLVRANNLRKCVASARRLEKRLPEQTACSILPAPFPRPRRFSNPKKENITPATDWVHDVVCASIAREHQREKLHWSDMRARGPPAPPSIATTSASTNRLFHTDRHDYSTGSRFSSARHLQYM